MPRNRAPVTITTLGRYTCKHCSTRFAWASPRPIDPPDLRAGTTGGRRGGGKPPSYCSTACAQRARKRKVTHIYTCEMCGATSAKRHTFTRFCSRKCSNLSRSGWHEPLPSNHWALHYGDSCPWTPPKPANPRWVAGTCLGCGDHFVDTWLAESSSRYCSKRCSTTACRNRRRLRLRSGNVVDQVNWRALVRRDGWACWICGDDCDPNDYEVRDGYFCAGITYPTLDHLVAVSLNGEHSADNARLAHLWCNSKRGADTTVVTR